jgi:hypothetical protein
MTIKQINKLKPGRQRNLMGMTIKALAELLTIILPERLRRRAQTKLNLPGRKRAVSAGAKRILSAAQTVVLVLIDLPHHLAHELPGSSFGGSAASSENLLHEIVPVLSQLAPAKRFEAENRFRRQESTLQVAKLDRLLIASFATPIPRPANQEQQKPV